MVAFGIGGERAAANIARIMLNGFGDERGRVGIAADKLGGSCSGEIDEIVEDENLAVALRARADADGGNGERGGDEPACLARNTFQHDGDGAGGFQSLRVGDKVVDGGGGFALHAIADAMYRLRREADVADHGNLGLGEGGDQSGAVAAAFDLHSFCACIFDEAGRVGDGFSGRGVVGAEGHVGHQQCVADRATDRARVVQHLLHGDGQSAVIAEHGHAQRVANENHVNAGLVHKTRGGIVVGG